MVFYLILSIFCVLGVIVLTNRAWLKRNKAVERNIYLASILLLIALFSFSIGKYNVKKAELIKVKDQYFDIMEEEGEFFFFDSNGNVVKEYKTIGEVLTDFFVSEEWNGKTGISIEEYKKNNKEIVTLSTVLFLYWILLLLIFERENDIEEYEELDDLKLLDKYNPMIAACIAQNRNATYKDLIAIIFNFIEKKKINLRIVSDSNSDKVKYKYMISQNPDSKYSMDMVEKYIYDWLFEKIPDFVNNRVKYDYISINEDNVIEIDLIKRIKAFSEEEDTYSKLKEIKIMNEQRLKKIGANKNSVPFGLLFFNNILMIIIVLAVCLHIYSNGLGISINNVQVLILMFILLFMLFILPIVYIFTLIILKTIIALFKTTEDIGEKNTGRKLVAKSFSIIITTMVLMIIVMALPIDGYLVYDVLLLGVGFLIISTDNYMIKHGNNILNDYYNLKRIENKIKEYSLMSEKNIEYIKIWDKYFVYSIALGIPLEVKKETDIIYSNMDNIILNKTDMQAIYFVCKNYFEDIWDLNFETEENIFSLISKVKKINDNYLY